MGVVDVAANQPDELRCCCGNEECVFLRHNCSILSSVERDVHTAARMGQTLLARHEAYMASAERDRLELTTRIEQLERDNANLEARGKFATDENHGMQQELDQLNEGIKAAETKIGVLEAALLDSQREVRRLENAAERAASLERQVSVLEEEQLVLRTTITRTQEEARTTTYRWKQAERGLSTLQEQLERMEKESKEERERHVEVMGRLERQRAVEKELNTAAGRLKGAAAAKSMTDSRGSSNVVSHFVRDLLQDNANLQVGMAELREMLLSSNDEIQMLREQLMYHQPAAAEDPGTLTTLQTELENKEPPTPPQAARVSQELHIHHHYHVAHKPETRKARKRRQGITPGVFTPPVFSAPGSPVTSSGRFQRGALPGPLLSPSPISAGTAATRWSLQEGQAEFMPSSAPSSPRSTNRDSVFDRVSGLQSPASPASPATSVDPTSPGWKSAHRKKVSEFSLRSISETAMFPSTTSPPPALRPRPLNHFIMYDHSSPDLTSYTTDDVRTTTPAYPEYNPTPDVVNDDPGSPASDFDASIEEIPRGLRRTVSHESIISLSNGLDIHTLKARPSQLTLRPLGLTAAGTNISAVTAHPTLLSSSPGGKRGSVILRERISQTLPRQTGGRVVSNPGQARGREEERGQSNSRAPSALGKLVAWRPWGGNTAGTATATASPETSPSSTPVLAATASPAAIPTLILAGDSTPSSVVGSPTGTAQLARSPQGSITSATASIKTAGSAAASVKTAGSAAAASMKSTASGNAAAASAAIMAAAGFRAPGINQPGAVPGFQEYWAVKGRRGAPSKVAVGEGEVGRVGEALREVLEERE
ncbi:hypothetical protein C8A05DRAFT_37124 [Staphylotrichum tortipilum]|uniref:Uncharacterized protein n=1 Tax=Staphylotrichum tortipilum TaxID=2831512 RepID=A0AAN6RRA6_9PEZI|nr:hypothetical protein C8A05DRAFT_37124 [Staphylotrichum longicolle]